MTFDEKEKAEENKRKLLFKQKGRCFYYSDCGVDFIKDQTYPEAAHIIIDSKVNIKKYGYEILRHPYNFVLTCKDCNSKAILNPESTTGNEHIAKIQEAIENETYL